MPIGCRSLLCQRRRSEAVEQGWPDGAAASSAGASTFVDPYLMVTATHQYGMRLCSAASRLRRALQSVRRLPPRSGVSD